MICTYISESEVDLFSKVEDKELNELFQEVRKAFNDRLLIQTTEYDRRSWWDKLMSDYRKTGKLYTLYVIAGLPEVQIVNFHQDYRWSINTCVEKSYIIAYFFGLLSSKHLKQSGL